MEQVADFKSESAADIISESVADLRRNQHPEPESEPEEPPLPNGEDKTRHYEE